MFVRAGHMSPIRSKPMPNPRVPKLGVEQRDSCWLDRLARIWQWDESRGWHVLMPDGTAWGSFQTVEGDGPFREIDAKGESHA
jgi:hypothetical protein